VLPVFGFSEKLPALGRIVRSVLTAKRTHGAEAPNLPDAEFRQGKVSRNREYFEDDWWWYPYSSFRQLPE